MTHRLFSHSLAHSFVSLRFIGRALLFAPLCLLAACANLTPASYPPINTSIAETKEWRMPLHREPGRVQLKLLIPRHGLTQIALLPAQKWGEGPIRISFSGYECSAGPEAHIKFYTSNTESHFKYFRAPLEWDNEVVLAIDWDKNEQTSITLNNETITVQAYIAFDEIQVSNNKETIKIKELQYMPSLKTSVRTQTEGHAQ